MRVNTYLLSTVLVGSVGTFSWAFEALAVAHRSTSLFHVALYVTGRVAGEVARHAVSYRVVDNLCPLWVHSPLHLVILVGLQVTLK